MVSIFFKEKQTKSRWFTPFFPSFFSVFFNNNALFIRRLFILYEHFFPFFRKFVFLNCLIVGQSKFLKREMNERKFSFILVAALEYFILHHLHISVFSPFINARLHKYFSIELLDLFRLAGKLQHRQLDVCLNSDVHCLRCVL